MGRVKANIDVNGIKCWTLFDTGARNSYIVSTATADLLKGKSPEPFHVALGGKEHTLSEVCIIFARIEEHPVNFDAYILDEIGNDEWGKPIEVLFGALAMQKWGIRPVPDEKRLDLTHYSKEFVEF